MKSRPNLWAGALACLVVIVLAGAYVFTSRGRATAGTSGHAHGAKQRERSSLNAEEDEPVVSLVRASQIGLKGWQPAAQEEPTDDDSFFMAPWGEGEARSLAASRPDLHVIEAENDGERLFGLSGLIEPRDREAIAASLFVDPVRVKGLGDAPPSAQLRSLGDALASVVELVGVEPSASGLLGKDAATYPAQRTALEAAAGQWPDSARVWRVMAIPPGAEGMSGLRVELAVSPPSLRADVVGRLKVGAGLRLEPADGRWIVATASTTYQNSQGGDRYLLANFLFDTSTQEWVLFEIVSLPNIADSLRWHRANNPEEIKRNTRTIDLVSVVPGYVVTSHGIVGNAKPR